MKRELDLTIAQNAILDLETYAGSAACVLCGSFLMRGTQTDAAICAALQQLIEKNDAFHIRIMRSGSRRFQVFDAPQTDEIEVRAFENQAAFDAFASDFAERPLPEDRLFAWIGIRLPDRFGFLLKLHHVIGDAWSGALLCRQFASAINGESLQAASFASEIEKQLRYPLGARYEADRQFFLEQAASDAFVSLFTKNEDDFRSDRFTATLPSAIYAQIAQCAAKKNTSVFAFLFSAFAILLKRMTGTHDRFQIGTTILNRCDFEEKNTVGLFVHTVPVVASVDPDCTFSAFLSAFSDRLISTMRHQKFHYSALLNAVQTSGAAASGSFDAVFSFQNASTDVENAETTWYPHRAQAEPLQVHVENHDQTDAYTIHYDYRRTSFTKAQIARLHEAFLCLLADAALTPEKTVGTLSLMTQAERSRVTVDFNATAVPYDKTKSIYALFEAQAQANPDRQAVRFKDQCLTYEALLQQIDDAADRLHQMGVKKGDVVAVHLDRSALLIVFQFAVIKIGGVFLPVDKRYPDERLRFLCSDCRVRLLISDATTEAIPGVEVISPVKLFAFEKSEPLASACYYENCYIIYTSGSTGAPKGCLLKQSGLVNFCINNNTLTALRRNAHNVFACVNSVAFDYFIAESLLPLLNGYTVVLCDEEESLRQDMFLAAVKKQQINVLMTTPTRLSLFFDDSADCGVLKNLDCVCTSGEPLTEKLLRRIYEVAENAAVFNPLGPSECTVWNLGGELDRRAGLDIHLGKPVANTQIYILDESMQPVPVGVTGELCIAGDGVGGGYLNRAELTKERFVDNPFGEGTMYKTGDLVFWREDGNVAFVGRNDFQVKINGQRIELGEIEAALAALDGVASAAVTVCRDQDARQLICAYYTGTKTVDASLRTKLRRTLPQYMLPHVFTYLEHMPLTTSGKIDRGALPVPDLHAAGSDSMFVAPETEAQIALCSVLQRVLSVERISLTDNFFALGGDSIRAIHVVSELHTMGFELSVSAIMQEETVALIAAKMELAAPNEADDLSVISTPFPLSPMIHAYLNAADAAPASFAQGCILSVDCDESEVSLVMDAIVRHHDLLRAVVKNDQFVIRETTESPQFSFSTDLRFREDAETEAAVSALAQTQVLFDLKNGPLVDVVFCPTCNVKLVKIMIHHFVVDLVSWEILLDDFRTALSQIQAGKVIDLPSKTASFPAWIAALTEYARDHIAENSRIHWSKTKEALDHVQPILAGGIRTDAAETFTFSLARTQTQLLLKNANHALQTRPNELLLAALALAAQEFAGGAVGIHVETHGRNALHRHINVKRTVGWFTSCFPILVEKAKSEPDVVVGVKEAMRQASMIGLDDLLLFRRLHPNADILFNYYNVENTKEYNVKFLEDAAVFPEKLNVNCVISDGCLRVALSIASCVHRKGITKDLGLAFQRRILALSEQLSQEETVRKTRSDFSDLDLKDCELKDLEDLFE